MRREAMNRFYKLLVPVLAIVSATGSACSKDTSREQMGKSAETTTRQAVEAIEAYGRTPIDKARKAQALGDDRLQAIDQATENMDSR